jgi:hypothetical protein
MITEIINPQPLTPPSIQDFFSMVNSRLKFRAWLIKNLPSAFFSGIMVKEANELACRVTVPYGWRTQNPFRSTYFACLAMAAEMSTGVLASAYVYKRKPPVSMLIVEMESRFYKKANGLTTFDCQEGWLIAQAVQRAIASGEGETIRVLTTGYSKDGTIVAEFWFTWSFRVRRA